VFEGLLAVMAGYSGTSRVKKDQYLLTV
jgi:hypothetical protein